MCLPVHLPVNNSAVGHLPHLALLPAQLLGQVSLVWQVGILNGICTLLCWCPFGIVDSQAEELSSGWKQKESEMKS